MVLTLEDRAGVFVDAGISAPYTCERAQYGCIDGRRQLFAVLVLGLAFRV